MAVYVKDKGGNRVKVAGLGAQGPAGKSAYQYAVEGGFSGSEDEFRALMGVRSNPNLLHNAYWAQKDYIINQQGQEEYASNDYSHTYAIDRWSIYGTGVTLTIEEGDIVLRNQSAAQGGMTERLEISQFYGLLGKTISLSILYKLTGGADLCQWQSWSNDGAQSDYAPFFQVIPESSEWNVITTTGRVEAVGTGSIVNYGGLFIHIDAGSELRLKAAKLELGPVQTLAHQDADGNWVLNDPPPDKVLELAKCQRYMLVLPNSGGSYCTVGTGYSFSTTEVKIGIPLPVTMRVLPAITLTGMWNLIGNGNPVFFDASTKAMLVPTISQNLITAAIGGFSGLTTCQTYSLENENDPAAKLILDANL